MNDAPVTTLEKPVIPDVNPFVSQVFGEPLFHTEADVVALAFAPDDTLWSVEETGVLRQWHAARGQQLRKYFLSDLETLWVFSPEARLVAAANDDLTLWDVESGRPLAVITQPSWVAATAFRGDGKVIATGHDDGGIRLWDVGGHGLIRELRGHKQPVSALAFSPDGTKLATAGEDKLIHIWNLADGQLLFTLTGHTDRIPAIAWHPRGQFLVSGGWDHTARVWSTASGEPVILLNNHDDQVNALTFSSDGRLLVCADSAKQLHVWSDATAALRLHVLHETAEELRCVAFSKNGQLLASAGVGRSIHLWDPFRGVLLLGSSKTLRHTISLSMSQGGPRLASTSAGNAVRVWDVGTGRVAFQTEQDGGYQALASSPDGRWLAGGGLDGLLHVWEAAAGEATGESLRGQSGPVSALAFAPDSDTLASGCASDGTVWLWSLAEREPKLLVIEAADGCTVESVVFHPQGHLLACGGFDWLATGGSDGAVCVWHIENKKKIALFDFGATSLAFHSQGKLLAAAALSNAILICDLETQDVVQQLTGHLDTVYSIAFSSDSRWLASGGDDRTLRLWDVRTGKALAVKDLDTPVMTLQFSPDNRFLFTGNGNTTCYQIPVEALLV